MIALIHKTRLIPIIAIIKNVAININWRRRIFSSKIVFSLYSHTLISSKKCSFKIKIYMLSKHIFSSFSWIWKVRIKWTRRKKLDEVQLTKNVWKDSFFLKNWVVVRILRHGSSIKRHFAGLIFHTKNIVLEYEFFFLKINGKIPI